MNNFLNVIFIASKSIEYMTEFILFFCNDSTWNYKMTGKCYLSKWKLPNTTIYSHRLYITVYVNIRYDFFYTSVLYVTLTNYAF